MSVRTLLELSVACIAVSMAACGSSAQRAFTPDDEAAIHAANQAYAKAEVAGDFDKWFAFSTPDAVYMPEQSKILRGREAISGWFKQLSPGGATLETTSEEITGHEDMALVSGSYVVSAPGGSRWPNITCHWQLHVRLATAARREVADHEDHLEF